MQVVGLLVEQKRDWLSSVPFYIIYKRFVSIDLTVMSRAFYLFIILFPNVIY